MKRPLALYLHWPYCLSKCPYCDFASRPNKEEGAQERWLEGILKELTAYAARLPDREIGSIYFGGGTPSLMKPATAEKILERMAVLWPLRETCEITLEANPSSSEKEKFKAFRAAGVNRLSLGVQSFDDAALRFLGRAHDGIEARRAIEAAASVFERYSFDLLYARAGQTLETWRAELQEALRFAPRHLSLYQLTLEDGTVFAKRARNETLQVSEDVAAQMFEETQESLTQAGLPAYEISNHAVAGQESRHNLVYWRYEDYLGLGPAAHGRFLDEQGARRATSNPADPKLWRAAVAARGFGAEEESLDLATAKKEALMMGLRLAQGIDLKKWEEKFGESPEAWLSPQACAPLVEAGFLSFSCTHLTATPAGRQRLNAMLSFLFSL